MIFKCAILLIAFTLCAHDQSMIPFVGCESDGQVGPREVPKGEPLALKISAQNAERLAFYKGVGLGVLAPRGWDCFGVYGSGGEELLVSPVPIDRTKIFSMKEDGLDGPVVKLSRSFGWTSGRFSVGLLIARVFPYHKEFVDKLIAEGTVSSGADFFHFGPYPADRLTYKSNEIVEYETPPNADGLGTHSGMLKKNASPIRGVAMLLAGEQPDSLLLSVRLPAVMSDLASIIIQ